jgi:uncharacterized protein (TIGR02147 family)
MIKMAATNSKQILQMIFEYDDYRLFLQEYFAAKKLENPSFSQRYFAKKAGFNAHNFCTLVMQGKRNLAIDSIQKIIKALGLKGKAGTYFENLVYLNQAITLANKEHYFERVKKIGGKTKFYQLHKAQFFFYEKWYYPVVRELLAHTECDRDFAALAKLVRPAITAAQAKEAVELLVRTGMVTSGLSGRYCLTNEFVSSERVPEFIKKKARRDVLLKGIETIDTIEPKEKYAAYSTITMSKGLYGEVRELLDETREKILSLVAEDKTPDEVYEVVFQVFPVSNMKGSGKALLEGSSGEI